MATVGARLAAATRAVAHRAPAWRSVLGARALSTPPTGAMAQPALASEERKPAPAAHTDASVAAMTDDAIFDALVSGKIKSHNLEKALGDRSRAVTLRRRLASQPADVAGGLAAASSTLAAMLCTINCTVVPALAAVLPALSGAASASSAAASGDAACSSCEATLPFLGVSTAALKTFTFVGVAPLGLYAVASAYKSHKSPAVASVGLAGVASILALNVPSSVFPGAAAAVTAAVEAAPLVTESTAGLGGALLMIAHLLLTRRLAATQAQARASCCAASKPSCCSGPKETKA